VELLEADEKTLKIMEGKPDLFPRASAKSKHFKCALAHAIGETAPTPAGTHCFTFPVVDTMSHTSQLSSLFFFFSHKLWYHLIFRLMFHDLDFFGAGKTLAWDQCLRLIEELEEGQQGADFKKVITDQLKQSLRANYCHEVYHVELLEAATIC
jgi:hypothetical protein